MKAIVFALLALSLAGCGSLGMGGGKKENRELIDVSCSGFASWEKCDEKAKALCEKGYDVEMKDESLQRYGLGSVLPRVMEALKPVQHQVNQISFSLPWCQILRRETQYPVGFIAENYNQLSDPAVQVLKPEFLCVDYQALPAQGSVVQPGSALFCWEVADPALALQLHARGVDYVETYEIGEMLKALK